MQLSLPRERAGDALRGSCIASHGGARRIQVHVKEAQHLLRMKQPLCCVMQVGECEQHGRHIGECRVQRRPGVQRPHAIIVPSRCASLLHARE